MTTNTQRQFSPTMFWMRTESWILYNCFKNVSNENRESYIICVLCVVFATFWLQNSGHYEPWRLTNIFAKENRLKFTFSTTVFGLDEGANIIYNPSITHDDV